MLTKLKARFSLALKPAVSWLSGLFQALRLFVGLSAPKKVLPAPAKKKSALKKASAKPKSKTAKKKR